jgi:CHAT domain-containing protein/Tfp pilus assembly protein PilF
MAAASLLVGLASCARDPGHAGEIVVLDERLTFVRGPELDTVKREFSAPVDGTCVAIVEEDDGDLILEMLAAADAAVPSKVEVESQLDGEGVEVAAIPVVRGSKIAVTLSMPPDMPAPARAQTRITCYDAAAQTPEILARVAAYRAWSVATLRSATSSEESIKRRRELLDGAIARLESDGRDARMAAWAHLVKGNMLHLSMLDLRGALTDLRAAEKSFAALQPAEPRNVARARFHVASTLAILLSDATFTDPTPAQAKAEAEKIFNELGAESSPLSALEKSRAVAGLGVVCYYESDYACATRYMEAAAEAVHKIGHRRDEVVVLNDLGVIAIDLGNAASAVSYFDRLLPLVSKTYSPAYASYHLNAGEAYSNVGDTSRAIKHLQLALEDAREKQSAIDLGRVMTGLGLVYFRRGDVQQAEIFFVEALKQRRIATEADGLIMTLNFLGRFVRSQGRTDEAVAMHREAFERASTAEMRTAARYELALDQAEAGRIDRAIALCRDSLREPNGLVPPIRRAQTQVLLAKYLIERHPSEASLAEADQLSQAGLTVALEKSDLIQEVSARQARARLLAARRQYVDARREYEAAIALIFDFRGGIASPDLQASALEIDQKIIRGYVDLLMRAAVGRGTDRFAPASPDDEAALRILELARSSGTSATQDVSLDAATQAKIDQLLQQMAAKRVRIAQLNNSDYPDGKLSGTLQLEMSQLRVEVDRLRGGSTGDRRSNKLPGAINRPWPAMTPGVAQLSYALGERHAYLWARDAHGLRVAVLAKSPARLERSLAEFGEINPVRSAAKLEQVLAELSASLLPAGTLSDASSSLEVVAEGRVGTLPFAALRVPGSGKRIVETHAVRMISSMFDGSAAASGKPRAMALVGIASNTGAIRSAAHVFPSLGGARAEARAIAELFALDNGAAQIRLLTAADGDEQTIRTLWAGGADAVHFATHGLANLRYPSASLLLLPKGGGQEAAYLTAGQVQEWRGDVGLVFLAACETAAGPARFAEGMSGLPRSFLTAGARGIVATLWPVEDVYESEFSVEFYRRFIVGRDAESALAETQREWLKPRPDESAGNHQQRLATAWAHVFHARPKSR